MRVRTWVGFCWLAFGLMLSACQSLPTAPQAEQADAANAAIQAGDLVAAAEAYERLAEAGRRQRNQYLLLAAEAWRDQGEIDQVARVLALLQTRKLTAAESLSHDLLQGEVLLARGEAVAAEALLTLPEESIPENRRGRFLELVARALAANGKLGPRCPQAATNESPAEPPRESMAELGRRSRANTGTGSPCARASSVSCSRSSALSAKPGMSRPSSFRSKPSRCSTTKRFAPASAAKSTVPP